MKPAAPRKLFKDESKLSFDYVPEKLAHREKQLDKLRMIFRPVLEGAMSQTAFLIGNVGTGKTATSKRFCIDLKKQGIEQGRVIDYIIINCRQRNSESAVLQRLVTHFDEHYPDRGFSIAEMLRAVRKHLEKNKMHLVVVLDEADILIRKGASDLIYQLSRFDEETIGARPSLSLILVSQKYVLDLLDPAAFSTFRRANAIQFEKYNAEELRDIVADRVELAFHAGMVRRGLDRPGRGHRVGMGGRPFRHRTARPGRHDGRGGGLSRGGPGTRPGRQGAHLLHRHREQGGPAGPAAQDRAAGGGAGDARRSVRDHWGRREGVQGGGRGVRRETEGAHPVLGLHTGDRQRGHRADEGLRRRGRGKDHLHLHPGRPDQGAQGNAGEDADRRLSGANLFYGRVATSGHEEDPLVRLACLVRCADDRLRRMEMPLQYTGIADEHRNVRKRVGMFDVSHMGDIVISGKGAASLVGRLMTNDPATMPVGKGIYGHILNDDGKIIDDTIVYRVQEDTYLMVPNASMTGTVFDWIEKHRDRQEVSDVTDQIACFAVQGPEAAALMERLTDRDLSSLKKFHFTTLSLDLGGQPRDVVTGLRPALLNDQEMGADPQEGVWPGGPFGARVMLSAPGTPARMASRCFATPARRWRSGT